MTKVALSRNVAERAIAEARPGVVRTVVCETVGPGGLMTLPPPSTHVSKSTSQEGRRPTFLGRSRLGRVDRVRAPTSPARLRAKLQGKR